MTELPDTAEFRRLLATDELPAVDVLDLIQALDAARAKEFHHRELIGHLKGRAEAADARIAAVRAVLDAHGPDGMNSAGYDLWSDVNNALLP